MEGEWKITRESLQKNRKLFEDLMKRRFYYSQAFEAYNSVSGLFDYGPQGCQVMNNILNVWREHFILEDDLLEVGCCNITPEAVLKASGHKDRFTDLMVKDIKSNNPYRADKLIIEHLEKKLEKEKKTLQAEQVLAIKEVMTHCESYSASEVDKVIVEYGVKSGDGNPVGQAEPFNLMFATQIGPTGTFQGYLRPETAQGIFMNFNKLLDFNGGRLPVGAAQVGLAFRNEISPRMGLLRVREFMMAEIEYFIDPVDKGHKKFIEVEHLEVVLLLGKTQESKDKSEQNSITRVTLGQAVEQQLIVSESLAYFMGRTLLFLRELGLKDESVRFRQHMSTEMAHYAQDCWDAEVETSYGWVECVGHADRSAFDLQCHQKATGTRFQASRKLKQHKEVEQLEMVRNNQLIGKHFKKEASTIKMYLDNLEQEELKAMADTLQAQQQMQVEINQTNHTITSEMVQFKTKKVIIQDEKFTPQVIEPSFGIGRLLYCVLEHAFRARDAKRTYLLLPPKIAPVKCSLLSVISNNEYSQQLKTMKKELTKRMISCKVDDGNATIGKRYARTDELAIPFAITVDNLTLDTSSHNHQTVTLREIQTLQQVRLPIPQLYILMPQLTQGLITWQQVLQQYPLFNNQDTS